MNDLRDLSWIEEKLLREELYRELEEQAEDGEPGTRVPPRYDEQSGLPVDPDGSLPFTYEVME